MVRACLVVTGTEVLEGRVRDENGAFVAAQLTARGVRVARMVVVDDALERITDQFLVYAGADRLEAPVLLPLEALLAETAAVVVGLATARMDACAGAVI